MAAALGITVDAAATAAEVASCAEVAKFVATWGGLSDLNGAGKYGFVLDLVALGAHLRGLVVVPGITDMARMQPMAKSRKANKIIAARAISRDPAATDPPSVVIDSGFITNS